MARAEVFYSGDSCAAGLRILRRRGRQKAIDGGDGGWGGMEAFDYVRRHLSDLLCIRREGDGISYQGDVILRKSL